jgi:excinuclease UvrABC ATPase subunit
VLDEPTSGRHMNDVDNLIRMLDWVIDLGPGAGHDRGTIVFEGPPAELMRSHASLTGQHLRRRLKAGVSAA